MPELKAKSFNEAGLLANGKLFIVDNPIIAFIYYFSIARIIAAIPYLKKNPIKKSLIYWKNMKK